mmetsp:Transcript_63226/g.147269  ORF Transcript_63226/g.147269 Transcript_63226/m.147269 type:complete len:102 (-) Transcript_63226:296-601(-)
MCVKLGHAASHEGGRGRPLPKAFTEGKTAHKEDSQKQEKLRLGCGSCALSRRRHIQGKTAPQKDAQRQEKLRLDLCVSVSSRGRACKGQIQRPLTKRIHRG